MSRTERCAIHSLATKIIKVRLIGLKWVSECCLTQKEQFFCYIMTRASWSAHRNDSPSVDYRSTRNTLS